MPNQQATGDSATSNYVLADLVFADSTKRTYTLENATNNSATIKERVEGLNLAIEGKSGDTTYQFYGAGMAQAFVSNNGEALVKIANVRVVEETIDIVYEY